MGPIASADISIGIARMRRTNRLGRNLLSPSAAVLPSTPRIHHVNTALCSGTTLAVSGISVDGTLLELKGPLMHANGSRRPIATPKRLVAAVLLVLAVTALRPQIVRTAPAAAGLWTTLVRQMPINPVHSVLLHNGKVLIVSGSGNVAANTDFESAIWDPAHPEDPIVTQRIEWDMFCNGIVVLPDGRAFINSGTLAYDPFKGERRSAVYDPATGSFSDVATMAHGRWYPTVTTLGDGRVM